MWGFHNWMKSFPFIMIGLDHRTKKIVYYLNSKEGQLLNYKIIGGICFSSVESLLAKVNCLISKLLVGS